MSNKTIKRFQQYMVSKGKAPANNPDVYRGVWWPHAEKIQAKVAGDVVVSAPTDSVPATEDLDPV